MSASNKKQLYEAYVDTEFCFPLSPVEVADSVFFIFFSRWIYCPTELLSKFVHIEHNNVQQQNV